MNIKAFLATKEDKNQLLKYFEHYKIKEIIENRVDCYLSHKFTVVAKDENQIIGVLQWYVKEDPNAGVVEFEEVHVSGDYRGKGVGSLLVEFAIQSVKDYFKKIKMTSSPSVEARGFLARVRSSFVTEIKPRKIFLFVNKENKTARALFEKYGFRLVSEVGDLFSENKIELLYSLKI